MAIIINIKENGAFEYSSVKGVGISEEDKENARKLNDLTKKEMFKITSVKKIDGGLKNKVSAYWSFGFILRKILETGLVLPGEKRLYWKNVRLHAPKEFLVKDRGLNRIHIEYCFRLAGYRKNLAVRRKWSEWVYLFDSPSINGENRFDEWDKEKIENEKNYTSRKSTRNFIQCTNSILEKIETKDLDKDELFRCYEGAWRLTKILNTKKYNKNYDFKNELKKAIKKRKNMVGQLMDNKISPDSFAKEIAEMLLGN